MPRLTYDQRVELHRLAQTTDNLSALARSFGVAPSIAQYYRDIAPRAPRPTDEQRAEIVQRFHNGETMRALSREFGVAEKKIQKILGGPMSSADYYQRRAEVMRKIGTRNRGQRGLPKAPTERAIRKHWLTVRAACELLGCDKSSLCERLRAGRIPGAFRLDEYPNSPWLIPRRLIEQKPDSKANP